MNNYFEYVDFAYRLYNYLNGRINHMVIATGLFCSNDIQNPLYAWSNGSTISINIAKLLDTYGILDNKYVIKGLIVDMMIHEFYHMDQRIDSVRYLSDEAYKINEIEQPVIASTVLYMVDHYSELMQAVGEFNIPNAKKYEKSKEIAKTYKLATVEQFYENSLHFYLPETKTIGLGDISSIRVMLNGHEYGVKSLGVYMNIYDYNMNIVNYLVQASIYYKIRYDTKYKVLDIILTTDNALIDPIRKIG